MVHTSVDDPELKKWAAKRLAEVLALEERGRLLGEHPPEKLKEIYHVLDSEVAPILDASGVEVTRDDLLKMFTDWYVKREAAADTGTDVPSAETATPPENPAPLDQPSPRAWTRFGAPIRRGVRLVGILVMLIPLVFVPAYFFVSTQVPPPAAKGVVTLSPAVPMLAPGQTQNYSVLTVTQPSSSASATTLSASSPDGLSLAISSSSLPASDNVTVPISIHASSSMSPGNYSVVVEERQGSAVSRDSFTVEVVPAFVVMDRFTFVPQDLTVAKGTKIYWMNLDSTAGCCDPGYHDVYFQGGGMNVTSPILVRLGTWGFTFDTPGEFYYYCSIHPYMVGKVTVTG